MHPEPQAQPEPQTGPAAGRPRAVRISHWLVPALLLWAAADVAGRFAPVGWLHVLPEHEATRRPGRYHPFIPDLTVRTDPWVGETALTGNLAPTETRTPVTFGTDALGFRRTPGVPPDGGADLILYGGSSFAYGGGLSDDETLPAVLTRDAGVRVYNGGHFWWDPLTLESLDWLTGRLKSPRSAVVMIYWEDADLEPQSLHPKARRVDRLVEKVVGRGRFGSLRDDLEYARRYAKAVWSISPVEVLSIRLYKALSNDRILPNRYRSAVEARTLPGGERMLFLEEEVARVLRPPGDDAVTRLGDYYAECARHLAAQDRGLFVVLVPNRYTLYGPALDGTRAAPADPYIDRVDRELRRRGVAALNGLAVLRPDAAGDLASGRLSFYREDHHWSPLGVERIARAFTRLLGRRPTDGPRATDAVQ